MKIRQCPLQYAMLKSSLVTPHILGAWISNLVLYLSKTLQAFLSTQACTLLAIVYSLLLGWSQKDTAVLTESEIDGGAT